MFDRLVCMSGGNPRPDLIDKKSTLKAQALEMLRKFRRASGGEIPLIGVGGIATAEDAWERIRAGASLIQLYTAMVYDGPDTARRISCGLAARLKQEGFANIAKVVGTTADP